MTCPVVFASRYISICFISNEIRFACWWQLIPKMNVFTTLPRIMQAIMSNNEHHGTNLDCTQQHITDWLLTQDLNPRPPTPKARFKPLDQRPTQKEKWCVNFWNWSNDKRWQKGWRNVQFSQLKKCIIQWEFVRISRMVWSKHKLCAQHSVHNYRLVRDMSPLAPKAGIVPLDQRATKSIFY